MKLDLQCTPVDTGILAGQWKDLQARAPHRFFTSWYWIENWLRTFKPEARVLSARFEGQIVALLLLCSHPSRVFRFWPVTTMHCNLTGDPAKDQIWPEYNCIMMDARYASEMLPAIADYLRRDVNGWDELVIGASTRGDLEALHCGLGLECLDLWESPSFGVDLNVLRDQGLSYLDSLSRNTRYQIRRAEKRYSKEGALYLERASSVEQALAFFREAGPVHRDRWGGSAQGSGFENPLFVRFHENLIRSGWNEGVIDIIRLRVGERVIACLYNFVYQQRVYFYLSALKQEVDAKLKPGLVAHAHAIQDYLDKGFAYYDFMGGDDRYKRSLGKESQVLAKVAFRKKNLIFQLENMARRVKGATLPAQS